MSWWDDFTTRMGDALIAPQLPPPTQPGGPGPARPPVDPAQRQALIANGLLGLGGTLSAAGRGGMGPVEGLGAGMMNLQAQGRRSAMDQLQMGLMAGRVGEAQRANQTRDMLARIRPPPGVDAELWQGLVATNPGAAFRIYVEQQRRARMAPPQPGVPAAPA